MPSPLAVVLRRITPAALAFSLLLSSALTQGVDPALLKSASWREIGPYRGGRCAAVTGIAGDPDTYYFGATGGGVWKTTDAGRSWRCVSDGTFGGSIGAVAVAPSDPAVVYVGGGEATVRGNVSAGDGVWKSTDAGRTWQHVGLDDSQHVCRLRVDPHDPDRVYAAVLGHLHGPNEERGVFRSRDGGTSWQRVLFVDDEVGAVDLDLDPSDPRTLYATTWRVRRLPWTLESGGKGSGLWKSTDGGDTWRFLSDQPGMPAGPIGICGVAVSPVDRDRVYAIVEAKDGGVFRSDDGGATWRRTDDDRALRQRAWYYSRIYADPQQRDGVYVVNVRFHHSVDGGRTFTSIGTPHGDNHDLWIAPNDPQRMIEGNDGGANVTFDGGRTWSPQDNQPTAQIYRVSVDSSFPYRLLGAQQDNSALRIRSRSLFGGSIGVRDWEPTAGGESGYVVAKPDDPDVVVGGSYGGYLGWLDHRSGERRAISVWPVDPIGSAPVDQRYRFQWNAPVFFSPHDPNTLYTAGNVLFRSRDLGASWQPISPDLTRDDPDKLAASGGPITKDNTGVEVYGTIFSALESPQQPGVLWAGSDDGLVHLSRDDGHTWQDVTPEDLPPWTRINCIAAHPFEPAGVYLAATRYELDDPEPMLYRTTDWGAHWQRIDGGIPDDHFTRVVRADPDRRGLLYAGTERGVYVSFDDGAHWQSLQGDLPLVPVTDLAVAHQDLIAATQGRGFWILDDLSWLHQLTPDIAKAAVHLFQPRPTLQVPGGQRPHPEGAGTNAPQGVVLRYRLAETPAADVPVRLTILDDGGEVVRELLRRPVQGDRAGGERQQPADADGDEEAQPHEPDRDERVLPAERGIDRFVWDMRYPDAEGFPGMVLWNRGGLRGALVVPGTYRAKLQVGDEEQEVAFEVRPNPLSHATDDDRRQQLAFLRQTHGVLTRAHRAVAEVRKVRAQVEALFDRARHHDGGDAIVERGKTLLDHMREAEEALYQTKNRSAQDPLNFPIALTDKLAGVAQVVAAGDRAPTEQARAARDELVDAIEKRLAELNTLWSDELPALNAAAAQAKVPAVTVPPIVQ